MFSGFPLWGSHFLDRPETTLSSGSMGSVCLSSGKSDFAHCGPFHPDGLGPSFRKGKSPIWEDLFRKRFLGVLDFSEQTAEVLLKKMLRAQVNKGLGYFERRSLALPPIEAGRPKGLASCWGSPQAHSQSRCQPQRVRPKTQHSRGWLNGEWGWRLPRLIRGAPLLCEAVSPGSTGKESNHEKMNTGSALPVQH